MEQKFLIELLKEAVSPFQCVEASVKRLKSWKIQRYAIDLPFNVFTIQYMSIFSNYNIFK